MNSDHPRILLASYDDLTVRERQDIDSHLAGCIPCRQALEGYRRQDADMRALPAEQMPDAVRLAVRHRRSAPGSRRTVLPGLGLIAALVALAASILLPLHRQPAVVVASGLPLLRRVARTVQEVPPNMGTARISYEALGGNDAELPAAAATYNNHQTMLIHWQVRDAFHYRVDVIVQRPRFEQGTVTYVRNGRTLTVYDHRLGYAVVGPAPHDRFQPAWQQLAFLRYGWQAVPGTAMPPIADASIARFTAEIRRRGSSLHPASYARIVGPDRVAGQPAHIVEYGPLERFDIVTGCSFAHPGHCLHHPRGNGEARVSIADRYPMVLRYDDSGMVPATFLPRHTHYIVTSLRFGVGPPASVLNYRPPVPLHRVSDPLVRALESGAGPVSVPGSGTTALIPVSVPQATPPLSREIQDNYAEPIRRRADPTDAFSGLTTTRTDTLYGTGRFRNVLGAGPHAAVGPYVLVQARRQVGGLPSGLRQGKPELRGGCAVYGGTYADGQHWAALQLHRVTILISTNTMTLPAVRQYAGQVCRGTS